jgi:hypothetical protein
MNQLYHYWQVCSPWEFIITAGILWAAILLVKNVCMWVITYPYEYYRQMRWYREHATTRIEINHPDDEN